MMPISVRTLALASMVVSGSVAAHDRPLVGSGRASAPMPPAVDSLPPDLVRDVRAGNQDWIAGLESGDATRVAAAYAPDALFCAATGACITGRAAVADHYVQTLKRFGRATSASVRSAALRVDGDLAFESGRAEARFANGQAVSGRYSTVWKRERDGHWRIFRNMSL